MLEIIYLTEVCGQVDRRCQLLGLKVLEADLVLPVDERQALGRDPAVRVSPVEVDCPHS